MLSFVTVATHTFSRGVNAPISYLHRSRGLFFFHLYALQLLWNSASSRLFMT